MRALFVDTAVLLLAIGAEHPDRQACRDVIQAAGESRVRLHLCAEAGQEFLFHRVRKVGTGQALREFDSVDEMVIWHGLDRDVLHEARRLMSVSPVRGRDAIHAATALLNGFTALVTADPDFDHIPGLTRLAPSQISR